MKLLRRIADNTRSNSLATSMRRRRFALFTSLLARVPRPVSILDVGGTEGFWETMRFSGSDAARIVLLNLEATPTRSPNVESVVGDATDLREYAAGSFDVVFSNSVIEHVGDFAAQRRMAEAVMRVGRRYFVQTPNYYFPIEPHFLFVGFQWLPLEVRARLHHRLDLGWQKRAETLADARRETARIRLLRRHEVCALFPGATLYEERILGMTKSFVAYGGW